MRPTTRPPSPSGSRRRLRGRPCPDGAGDAGPALDARRAGEPSSSPVPAPRPADTAGHLHQVDTVRVIAFTAVIAVHVVNGVLVQAGLGGSYALALLLVTRKAFFVLIALVAAQSWMRRPAHRRESARTFWRRRLPLIAVPYAVWTVVYGWWQQDPAVASLADESSPLGLARRYVGLLLTGDASYHLYFLLASLQVYLVLPLLLRLVPKLGWWQLPLLGASLLVQVGQHALIEYGTAETGLAGWYRHNCGELGVTYQFWVLLGLVIGLHLERVQQVVDRLAVWIVLATVGAGLLAVEHVRASIATGESPGRASSTFSPYLVPWYLAAIFGIYAAACLVVRAVGTDGRAQRAVHVGAQASFGIYLAHPLLLPHLGRLLAAGPPLPLAVGVVLLTALTAGTTLLLVSVLRWTPLSKPLCGRPRKRRATGPGASQRGGSSGRPNHSHSATRKASTESRSAAVTP